MRLEGRRWRLDMGDWIGGGTKVGWGGDASGTPSRERALTRAAGENIHSLSSATVPAYSM